METLKVYQHRALSIAWFDAHKAGKDSPETIQLSVDVTKAWEQLSEEERNVISHGRVVFSHDVETGVVYLRIREDAIKNMSEDGVTFNNEDKLVLMDVDVSKYPGWPVRVWERASKVPGCTENEEEK